MNTVYKTFRSMMSHHLISDFGKNYFNFYLEITAHIIYSKKRNKFRQKYYKLTDEPHLKLNTAKFVNKVDSLRY